MNMNTNPRNLKMPDFSDCFGGRYMAAKHITKPFVGSGFARQKVKVARLTELYQNLLNEHDQLLSDYHRIESDYATLEAGFDELSRLNETLAEELKKLKSQQRGPVRYGTTDLMGGIYGR
jgi:hypothetical protein